MESSQSATKSVDLLPHRTQSGLKACRLNLKQGTGSGGGDYAANSLLTADCQEAHGARNRYNPLTAADEKITLSVGHVNNKPQYLVFSLQLWHLLRKQRQSPVESLDASRTARGWAIQFAPNAVHTGVRDSRSRY
jgi:hypothetical protein